MNAEQNNQAPELSIVIPIFNEEETIPELWARLKAVLDANVRSAEVILVDDGSHDRSAEIIRGICQADTRVRLLRLSRNFGHQPALSAGIDHARGAAIVLMDGDLQDRPESIPDFIAAWEQGAEVVYAIRASRQEHAALRLAFKGFYRILGYLSRLSLPLDAGIFCLLDRRVVNVLRAMPERHRYFPGLRAYAGFRQVGIPIDRDARYAGTTRVGLGGLAKLALDAVFSFSYLPLRISTFLGLGMAFFSFLYLVIVLIKKLVTHTAILGWASSLGMVLLLGGIQLTMLGLLGEFIGRIYDEVKKRPFYIIAEQFQTPGSLPNPQEANPHIRR